MYVAAGHVNVAVAMLAICFSGGCTRAGWEVADGKGSDRQELGHANVDARAVMARVTELDIPQPIAGNAFDRLWQQGKSLAEIPHFVVTNVGTVALSGCSIVSRYSVRGVSPGSDPGFGSSATEGVCSVSPGASFSLSITNVALRAGSYEIIACAWAAPELPPGAQTYPVFDPAHCKEATVAVSR